MAAADLLPRRHGGPAGPVRVLERPAADRLPALAQAVLRAPAPNLPFLLGLSFGVHPGYYCCCYCVDPAAICRGAAALARKLRPKKTEDDAVSHASVASVDFDVGTFASASASVVTDPTGDGVGGRSRRRRAAVARPQGPPRPPGQEGERRRGGRRARARGRRRRVRRVRAHRPKPSARSRRTAPRSRGLRSPCGPRGRPPRGPRRPRSWASSRARAVSFGGSPDVMLVLLYYLLSGLGPPGTCTLPSVLSCCRRPGRRFDHEPEPALSEVLM